MSATNLAVSLYPETLRTLAFGSISGTYAGIGTALAFPSRVLYITNTTDVLLTFSFDGVNNHFVIPSQSYILLDISSNQNLPAGALAVAQGTRIYVMGSPSLGSVYLTTFYGRTNS